MRMAICHTPELGRRLELFARPGQAGAGFTAGAWVKRVGAIGDATRRSAPESRVSAP